MELKTIKSNSKHLEEIEKIYLEAFPSPERIPFSDIKSKKQPNGKLLGIFENGNLVGMTYFVEFKNNFYIEYFAIEKTKRNMKLGTQALQLIKTNLQNKTIIFSIEKPISKTDFKSKRLDFYLRNGFKVADFEFICDGVNFYMMYLGEYNEKEFINSLLSCFPTSKNFKYIKTQKPLIF